MDRGKQKTVSHGRGKVSTQSSKQQVNARPSTQKHSKVIEVGASMIKFIKGEGGATQKKIEDETRVKITFPSSRKDSVVIEGDSTESITRASKRIERVIDEAANSPSLNYTHFISLPLAVHPDLVKKLDQFRNSILGISELDQNANSSKASASNVKNSKLSELGIERSIFINPKTLHLTVLMLKLWNKQRVEAAAEVLQSVSSKVTDALRSHPVSIRLKGLECMRGSFNKAYVLYAPVEEIGGEGRLLRACQVIIDAFVEAGLVVGQDAKKLKLHATVMNAGFRKKKMGSKKAADWFDARSIVDRYGSEEWGVYLIHEAHLSQRFVYDGNGYYHCCASIPFPVIRK